MSPTLRSEVCCLINRECVLWFIPFLSSILPFPLNFAPFYYYYYPSFIDSLSVFNGAPDALLAALAVCFRQLAYPPREMVMAQGCDIRHGSILVHIAGVLVRGAAALAPVRSLSFFMSLLLP